MDSKTNLKKMAEVGILTIISKNGKWFVHLQRTSKLGFLTAGESVAEKDFDLAITKLSLRVSEGQ